MEFTIAIVGRPNVGKSTLFNRLTATRDALVVDRPGVTRDCQYGAVSHHSRSFTVIDTGGVGEEAHDSIDLAQLMAAQAMAAAAKATVLIWLVDGAAGLSQVDEQLAADFRRLNKPIFLAVNKLEEFKLTINEFYRLGIHQIFPISAKYGHGITTLLDAVVADIPKVADEVTATQEDALVVSVLGRPNVGKSTLVNKMLGSERVLVFDQAGTTRDSIKIPFRRANKNYMLIDTAGVRKKSKVHDTVEKFSILKSFEAINLSTIVILLIDASEGVTEQDVTLLGMITASGKSVIIAVNKADTLSANTRAAIKTVFASKLSFADYAKYHFISALHGTGVSRLFSIMTKIERSLALDVSTADINRILTAAITANPPSMIKGRRIKLRYAHLGGTNPIRIVVHGNQLDQLTEAYKRYLLRVFREQLNLFSTPVLIHFKQNDNPFNPKTLKDYGKHNTHRSA